MDYITKTDAFKAILDALAEERSVYDAIAALPNADAWPVVRGEVEAILSAYRHL